VSLEEFVSSLLDWVHYAELSNSLKGQINKFLDLGQHAPQALASNIYLIISTLRTNLEKLRQENPHFSKFD
jgi:hypothetical protein